MSTGGRKGREAKMYIVEFIFFGGSRLFRETLTSVDEVEQFLSCLLYTSDAADEL